MEVFMQSLNIEFPNTVIEAYKQLSSIPYYKVDESTYAFASHIITNKDSTKNDTYLQYLLESNMYPNAKKIFQEAIDTLSHNTIQASDLSTWTTYHRAKGTVLTYQSILASVYHKLLADEMNNTIHQIMESCSDEDANDEFIADVLDDIVHVMPDTQQTDTGNADNVVLNHNNPFADISIRNQQFIYASDSDQFGTLSLNTSHTVTRVQHDEDTSYLVMQPGFKIKTTNSVQTTSPQEVIFDDVLTNEIAQQDDKIYVYIN